MTDAIDEKTELENTTAAADGVDADALFDGAGQESGVSGAAPAGGAGGGAESATADAGAASGSTAGNAAEGKEDAPASGGDAEEEDPWAAALAEQEAAEAARPEPAEAPGPKNIRGGSAEVFQPLASAAASTAARDLDIVMNIPVKLNVELGRTKISIRQLLELAQGSVLELDGLAGDPMDILINGYLIAQGEVVVVEERYGIRITDIITPTERVEKLNR
jgi:flagellar motor switch protein FliN/FliY